MPFFECVQYVKSIHSSATDEIHILRPIVLVVVIDLFTNTKTSRRNITFIIVSHQEVWLRMCFSSIYVLLICAQLCDASQKFVSSKYVAVQKATSFYVFRLIEYTKSAYQTLTFVVQKSN